MYKWYFGLNGAYYDKWIALLVFIYLLCLKWAKVPFNVEKWDWKNWRGKADAVTYRFSIFNSINFNIFGEWSDRFYNSEWPVEVLGFLNQSGIEVPSANHLWKNRQKYLKKIYFSGTENMPQWQCMQTHVSLIL